MIAVTRNGQNCLLVTEEANWDAPPKLTPSFPSTNERGATGREERYAVAATLRCQLEYTATLTLSDMTALRNALQAALAQPILMPCWPLAHVGADWNPTAHTASNLVIGWMQDFSSYAIADLTVPEAFTPANWDYVAPLLWGFFDKPPEGTPLSDEVLSVAFQFTEDGPAVYALIPAPAFTVVPAPALSGFAVAAFPWEIDWAAPVKSGTATVTIAHDEIGPGRQRLDICFPQTPARPIEGGVTLETPSDIGAFLKWFLAQQGNAGLQWVSSWIAVTRLAADAAAGANTITVEDATKLGGNSYLALSNGSGTVGEIVKVNSIAGNVLTLAAVLVNAYTAAGARCSLAVLGRHAADHVELTFDSDYVAHAKLQWVELTQEYSPPAGETRGTTLGVLPTVAWLFEFERNYGGVYVRDYATSFETNISALDETNTARTWITRLLDFSDMTRSLDLADHELQLTGEYWAGGPFDQGLPGQLSAIVTLRLFKCTVAAGVGSNVQQMWEGTVKAAFDATKVTAAVAGPSEIFKLQLPTDLFGPTCNAMLFDARCTLTQSAWQFGGTVTAIAGNTITIGTLTHSGGTPAGFGTAHWFALGIMRASIAGVTRVGAIYDSGALTSGTIVLTLRSPYAGAISDVIQLWPGCDKQWSTCQAYDVLNNPGGKFNNAAHFRGCPCIPALAPQFTLPLATNSGGKK